MTREDELQRALTEVSRLLLPQLLLHCVHFPRFMVWQERGEDVTVPTDAGVVLLAHDGRPGDPVELGFGFIVAKPPFAEQPSC